MATRATEEPCLAHLGPNSLQELSRQKRQVILIYDKWYEKSPKEYTSLSGEVHFMYRQISRGAWRCSPASQGVPKLGLPDLIVDRISANNCLASVWTASKRTVLFLADEWSPRRCPDVVFSVRIWSFAA